MEARKPSEKPSELTDAALQSEWEALMQTDAVTGLTESQASRLRALETELTERGHG